MKNNVPTTINTHHPFIICMKEYENQSLEELCFEDYSVGRKGPTPLAGTQAGGLFGSTATTQATPLFGQYHSKHPFLEHHQQVTFCDF